MGASSSGWTVTSPYPVMISEASFRSSSKITWERTAPRVWAVFLARGNLARRAFLTPGMTSSTTKIVVSSRHVLSETPPVVVRVVTPRTTEHTPPASSTGVTPPWSSVSSSLSP